MAGIYEGKSHVIIRKDTHDPSAAERKAGAQLFDIATSDNVFPHSGYPILVEGARL